MNQTEWITVSLASILSRVSPALVAPHDRAAVDAAFADLESMREMVALFSVVSGLLHSLLATLSFLRGRPEDALEFATTALARFPVLSPTGRTRLLGARARALIALGRRDEARAHVNRIARELATEVDRATYLAHPPDKQVLALVV